MSVMSMSVMSQPMARSLRLGIVGARGYAGAELIKLVAAHPAFELAFVSSREREGQHLSHHQSGYAGALRYVAYGPDTAAAQDVHALVLALPNGKAAPFVAAVEAHAPGTVIVDLSAKKVISSKAK